MVYKKSSKLFNKVFCSFRHWFYGGPANSASWRISGGLFNTLL